MHVCDGLRRRRAGRARGRLPREGVFHVEHSEVERSRRMPLPSPHPLMLPLETHPFHIKRDPSAGQWAVEESHLYPLVFSGTGADHPSVRTVLRYAGHPHDIARHRIESVGLAAKQRSTAVRYEVDTGISERPSSDFSPRASGSSHPWFLPPAPLTSRLLGRRRCFT